MINTKIKKELLGKSVEGRDVSLYQFGTGAKNILLIGGTHGDEPQSIQIAEKLIELLKNEERAFEDKALYILPILNPDGYHHKTRVNANGVDLNRNFATENWRSSPEKDDYYPGDAAESEPETQILTRLIKKLNPELIITLHQPYRIINFDGPAKDLALIMSDYNKYVVEEYIGYPTPGSFGTYAGVERQIPTITLELPENEPLKKVWKDNKQALLEVFAAV